jgi:isopentenyl-diphosphate Delta-isomerase
MFAQYSKTHPAIIFAIAAFLATGAFFMVNVELPPWSHYVSGVNVIVFAVPAFWATRWWLGWRDAVLLWVMLGIYALLIETSAIYTGFPYGHFGYAELLGAKLFGVTPWTVFLAWTPLMVGAYAVAARLFDNVVVRIAAAAVIATVFDLVLDPGAVRLGFWQYEGGGFYYGVPVSNFLGWLVSCSIGAALIEAFLYVRRPLLPVPVQLALSAFAIIYFWSCIALFGWMPGALAVGVAVMIAAAVYWARFYYAFDDMIVFCDESGTPTGTYPKLAAHDGDTKRHLAFSVFIFNDKGELLLQQRALTKKTWPGVWSNSACGHVKLHEKVESAARRRLRYELGMRVDKLHLVLPDFRYRAEKDGVVENEICPVFVGFTSFQPVPNPAEVNDVKWVDWEQFVNDVADPANGYSPWAREEVVLLTEGPQFQQFYSRIFN